MSKKITIEEEKRIASWYGDELCSQEYIRRNLHHGRNQVNRILRPKNIAYLLYDEMELHDVTSVYSDIYKEENERLNEQAIIDNRAFWWMTWLAVIQFIAFLLAYYL